VEEYRKRDPLLLLKQTILTRNLGTEADFKQCERDVGGIVTAAVRFADDSPFPSPSALHADILQE
jgi:pyruvate dehydrogenase E1 component alpha subunit